MRSRIPRRSAGLIAAGVVLAATAAYAATGSPLGVIGPATGIQPSGRHLEPVGRITPLGNLTTGGALTPNGRFLWALSTGRGRNDVRIVDLTGPQGEGEVVQTIPFPGLSGGVAMSPDGHTAYV